MLTSYALILLLLLLASSSLNNTVHAADQVVSDDDYISPVNVNDGPANLAEGQRLFNLKQYNKASTYLWRAVILHSSTPNNKQEAYKVDDAFTPFLQCYLYQNKVVDGLTFIAAESYMRDQISLGELYLKQALERDGSHLYALKLKHITDDSVSVGDGDWQVKKRLMEIRDAVDIAKEDQQQKENVDDDFWDQFKPKDESSTSTPYPNNNNNINEILQDKTPEELYNIATQYFNTKQLQQASSIFQLSCTKSNMKLYPACTNAIYLRTNLCDWGYNGTGFERDMKIIEEVTKSEVQMYRSVKRDGITDEMIRANGIANYDRNNNKDEDGIIHWQRSTSVHPHMMLGYPLSNDQVILKRYASESQASMDELRARIEDDGTSVKVRPNDLPYSVKDMRTKFLKQHEQQIKDGASSSSPIKVGFVACSFNSKAVLYLSHDMFRFFDPSLVEIHIFSTGPPDHPNFIHNTMHGVDWRQRVIDTVDYFHDVQEYQNDHIGLARYIHKHEIQILIEWDGYARQGERAAGLMALRPAPIQILHQEFLMTSGAQYFDYIVTDERVSPLRLEHLYTEKFMYMPNHFFSKGHAVQKEVLPPSLEYIPRKKGEPFQLGIGSPQENACMSSNPLGRHKEHNEVSFVYCNFNKFLKHNPETIRSWIRILEEVDNSILCLLENPEEGVANLQKFINEATTENKNDSKLNINDRIHFLQWEKNPYDHQQRSYSLCNAMLDSHPYNGHTTAQDALYAGVPIVTRSDGDDMSSRVSTSANVVLGLDELNACRGSTEYEDIAIRLGKDTSWFNTIRTKLINTCLQTNPMHPYWDVPRYVSNFESGLRMIWNKFLSGETIDHVHIVEEEDKRGGTLDTELVAKEEKRRNNKKQARRQLINDDEL